MSELQLNTNYTGSGKIELSGFGLPQNYSVLINKLEQLALGLDAAFGNLSLDHKEVEIALSGTNNRIDLEHGAPTAEGRAPPPHAAHAHGMGEVEYSRVISDIWIGVILTLLIVSVIFFICSCFLYHKFQQWKNSYRTSPNEPTDICRRYASDFEAESLPSYTIVSGLPTYDDALEEFRKAGIILTPPIPFIKIFENNAKDSKMFSLENVLSDTTNDNVSLNSSCICGAANISSLPQNNSVTSLTPPGHTTMTVPQIIELSPEHLAVLSQKRLSLQIAFNSSMRRNSRPRVDLYREVNHNNMLRNAALNYTGTGQIHRASSSLSLTNERNLSDHHLQHMQHRGSLY